MIFMCLRRFLFRLKHILWVLCGFYAESLPLNFTWEGRNNKETLFCNLIYCLISIEQMQILDSLPSPNLTSAFIKIFKA